MTKKNLLITAVCSFFINDAFSQKFEQVKVSMTINASKSEAFNAGLQADLSNIFKKYKSLPAITKTDLVGTWTKPNLSRTIFFEDSTQVFETLLSVNPHQNFSYRVEKFTSPLKRLAHKIEGDWTFTEIVNNQTQVEWNYNIYYKNIFARTLLKLAVKRQVKGYLTNALKVVKYNVENKVMTIQNPI
jgi:ribosome-associated toxin RatA of RatAB toxin-antitoxin module